MSKRNVKVQFLCTTINTYVIIALCTRATENLVLPVMTCHRLQLVELCIRTVVAPVSAELRRRGNLILVHTEVVWIHHADFLHYLLPAERSVEVYVDLTFLTALGCNDNDTVSTARTVDSGGSSILQHVDCLDIRRRDVVDRGNLETIHDVERRVILRQRTTATHTDGDVGIRRTFSSGYVYTSHLTSKSLSYIRHWNVLNLLSTYLRDSTCKVTLTNCGITDSHNFVKHLCIILH